MKDVQEENTNMVVRSLNEEKVEIGVEFILKVVEFEDCWPHVLEIIATIINNIMKSPFEQDLVTMLKPLLDWNVLQQTIESLLFSSQKTTADIITVISFMLKYNGSDELNDFILNVLEKQFDSSFAFL